MYVCPQCSEQTGRRTVSKYQKSPRRRRFPPGATCSSSRTCTADSPPYPFYFWHLCTLPCVCRFVTTSAGAPRVPARVDLSRSSSYVRLSVPSPPAPRLGRFFAHFMSDSRPDMFSCLPGACQVRVQAARQIFVMLAVRLAVVAVAVVACRTSSIARLEHKPVAHALQVEETQRAPEFVFCAPVHATHFFAIFVIFFLLVCCGTPSWMVKRTFADLGSYFLFDFLCSGL